MAARTPPDHGTIVDTLDGRAQRATQAVVQRALTLRDQMGDRPFGTEKLTPEQMARKYLPTWLTFANAADPVSVPWSTLQMQKRGWGPRSMRAWDRRMRQLWNSDQGHALEAILNMSPEQLQFFQWMKQQGLHSGSPRPVDAPQGTRGTAPRVEPHALPQGGLHG